MGIMLNTRQRVIGSYIGTKCNCDLLYIITKYLSYPRYIEQFGCLTLDSCYIDDNTPMPKVDIPLLKNIEKGD